MPRKEVIDTIDHDAFFGAIRELGTIAQAAAAAGMTDNRISHAILFVERSPPTSLSLQGRIDLLARRRSFASATYRSMAEHYVDRAEKIEALPIPKIVRASFESRETRDKLAAQSDEIAALRARLAAVDARGEVKQGDATAPSADRRVSGTTCARKRGRYPGAGRGNVLEDPENPNSQRFGAEIDAKVEAWKPGDAVPNGFMEVGGELIDVR